VGRRGCNRHSRSCATSTLQTRARNEGRSDIVRGRASLVDAEVRVPDTSFLASSAIGPTIRHQKCLRPSPLRRMVACRKLEPSSRNATRRATVPNFGLLIEGIMSTATIVSTMQREPELLGQTVVVIGGSGGIGLETSRRARVERAKVTLAGRNPERLQHAASESTKPPTPFAASKFSSLHHGLLA
jgi:short chain dehydrogenase